ncbi:MAG: homoserine dehydrogenase, partial [Agathobacter sp.]|nr:homoserine dehydrogenase [Agathobacter sp.]
MKIAVMGYGTIGSGVVEVLQINKDLITKRVGEAIEVKYILDLRDFPGDPYEHLVVHDYKTILEDEEVSIVVEAMGGVEPAYTFVKAMLLAGKQVTTSNKNLVAEKGAELLAIARERNINFMFGASVGGGIPIIRPLNRCLTADMIEEITGILNGTTNYMLTHMAEEGVSFEDILKDAQAKGYAEKDPTADVEGIDPC